MTREGMRARLASMLRALAERVAPVPPIELVPECAKCFEYRVPEEEWAECAHCAEEGECRLAPRDRVIADHPLDPVFEAYIQQHRDDSAAAARDAQAPVEGFDKGFEGVEIPAPDTCNECGMTVAHHRTYAEMGPLCPNVGHAT